MKTEQTMLQYDVEIWMGRWQGWVVWHRKVTELEAIALIAEAERKGDYARSNPPFAPTV